MLNLDKLHFCDCLGCISFHHICWYAMLWLPVRRGQRSEVMQTIRGSSIACSASFPPSPSFSIQDKRGLQLFGMLHDHCLYDFKSTTYC